MPQGDKASTKMAIKVTKGQISDCTISQYTCHEDAKSFIALWKMHNIINFGGYAAILSVQILVRNTCIEYATAW